MPDTPIGNGGPPPGEADGETGDSEPAPSFIIDVFHDAGDWSEIGGAEHLARAAAEVVADELALRRAEVCIALSNDAEVAELNASYRGKPAPTNVLSFPAIPMVPIEGDPRFLGDVVLALETLQREAADMGVPLAHHMQHLVVHGLLHLLGYDHLTDDEAKEMESLEVRILARLDVADPYATAGELIDARKPESERD
ncbi:MAG: rRNA maturation RNase YbeY [Hyphomicrobium sp.]|jgi:probable rRNA maturation factor